MSIKSPRGIRTDLQTPRTKLLYFIYLAPGSRIKNEPGIKSKVCKALGYKSDGHFHYDWNYLLKSGMLREEHDYFVVTDQGKEEFALHSTASKSNSRIIAIGITLIFFFILVKIGVLPEQAIAVLGVVLVFLGYLSSMISKRNEPELPIRARILLKEMNR